MAFTLTAAVVVGLVIGRVSSLAATGFELSDALQERGPWRRRARPARHARCARRRRSRAGRRAHGRRRTADSQLRHVAQRRPGLPARVAAHAADEHSGRLRHAREAPRLLPRRCSRASKRCPACEAVGGTTRLPLGSTNVTTSIAVEGRDVPESARPEAEMRRAMHDYFGAMGIPVLEGRVFTRDDGPGALPVAVINRAFADRLFGRAVRSATGAHGRRHRRRLMADDRRRGRQHPSQGLEVTPAPEIYIHYLQGPPVAPFLAIRAAGDPAALGDAVRAAIPRASIARRRSSTCRTMMQVRSASVSQRRFVLASRRSSARWRWCSPGSASTG